MRTPVTPAAPAAAAGAADLYATPPFRALGRVRSRRQALISLPTRNTAAHTARQFASHLLQCWRVAEEARDDAVLVVSELATNAVEHGHRNMTIHLALASDTLHISVVDHGAAETPAQGPVDWEADEHGRGLFIVDALTTRLEAFAAPEGWYVYATLRVVAARDGSEGPHRHHEPPHRRSGVTVRHEDLRAVQSWTAPSQRRSSP